MLTILLVLPVKALNQAPFIQTFPNLDISSFYAFTSYETGRSDYVTFIMNIGNYSAGASGPSYPLFDQTGLYEFRIDVNGDAREDRTFRFKFFQEETETSPSVTVSDQTIDAPFISAGTLTALEDTNRARKQYYKIRYIPSKRATQDKGGFVSLIKGKLVKNNDELADDDAIFQVPEANLGSNSIADYDSYASSFIYEIKIPRKGSGKKKFCDETGKVFVGPRAQSFKANLSGLFDNLNMDLSQAEDGQTNEYANNNTLSIALEIPKACLEMPDKNPDVIGTWATTLKTAREIIKDKPSFESPLIFTNSNYVQVSRMGHPLVTAMLIGHGDKNLYNATQPHLRKKNFNPYIQYPALASMLDAATSLNAPSNFPREDLEELYLTGTNGLNMLNITIKSFDETQEGEMLRLNLSTSAVVAASQNRLGVLASDNAGYPNGCRPGDDIVDIFFRNLFGARQDSVVTAPDKDLALTDGVLTDATEFKEVFPYLNNPN